MEERFKTSPGFPFPFGPSKHDKGYNFALFSHHATSVTLCLFEPKEDKIVAKFVLNSKTQKTGTVWHIFVDNLPPDFTYAYFIEGPYDPLRGHYYETRHYLLDPYAKQLATPNQWGVLPKGVCLPLHRGVVGHNEPFHWDNDQHPQIPYKDLIIYEMHVRGFTRDSSANVTHQGTFLGIIEKIEHFKSLGINAVELLPIFEFHETQNPYINCLTKESLYQYWGYSTVNFFAPMNRYGTGQKNTISEFKMLVKALHKAGIEVILDVVYNHTAEGNENGPVISFKGIENSVYYLLGPNGEYYNFSGCGNTLNCNHPVVRDFIRDSLRYWVLEMHVDGFRFDLASVLTRSHDGTPLHRPPLIEMLTMDPILANTKLIAEAWDAAGLYQVGSFPGLGGFAEWNGVFRDGVRRFIKGTDGAVGNFATRISGSEDLYGKGRSPAHSINYITSHDGFSLADLVSYNQKHNEQNGEENRDGQNDNESWNCGVEGPTDDPEIIALRKRQMCNFHLALMVSQGVPMLLMGDEYGHTKMGNNNSWGHDSPLNWFQWDTLEQEKDFFYFYSSLINFRKKHPVLTRSTFLREKDVIWHGREVGKPEWGGKSRFLGFTLPDFFNHYTLYIAFNAYAESFSFELPKTNGVGPWKRIVDTSKEGETFIDEEKAPVIKEELYTLPAYSALLLKRNL